MSRISFGKRLTVFAAFAVLAVGNLAVPHARAARDGVTVIILTQTGCQFLESENGVDREYLPKAAADCKAINAKSGAERLSRAKVLTLKPGKYVFRVTNRNVPYPLGFWLRSEGYDWRNPIHKLTKTNVSGGGLTLGATREYEIDLKPGTYLYSCPLNPTPDYRLVVE